MTSIGWTTSFEHDPVAMRDENLPGPVSEGTLFGRPFGTSGDGGGQRPGGFTASLVEYFWIDVLYGMGPEMALRLEKAFGTSRQAWLHMQQNYDLWHALQDADLSNVRVFVPSAEE